jgi:hypothetical protein
MKKVYLDHHFKLWGIVKNEGKRIDVFCPFCKEWHIHRWSPESTKPEPRDSACKPSSPLYGTGYMVGEMSVRRLVAFALLDPVMALLRRIPLVSRYADYLAGKGGN